MSSSLFMIWEPLLLFVQKLNIISFGKNRDLTFAYSRALPKGNAWLFFYSISEIVTETQLQLRLLRVHNN